MAQIKIYGDIDSASIFFVNSTVDPKPMGTIVASLKSDEDRIVIQRNDRFEADGVTLRTIFRRFNPTRVQNRDGQDLVSTLGYSTQEVIDYINAQANLQGVTGGDSTGTDLTGLSVCFKLDDTSKSVMMSNGYEFGVNTIKAVANGAGFIDIKSMLGDRTHFSNLEAGLACKGEDDSVIAGGLNDVINYLNELFTVGAFEQVVISDPYSTMVADIDGLVDSGSLVGSAVVDPIGNDIGGNTQTHNNNAGYLSSETIDQAGEYFTFDIRGEGQIGFGLVHTQNSYDGGYYSGNSTYANPASFCNGVNSSHYGYQFSHFFHPTPNGSWTNYGANTGYSMRSGWSNFNGTNEQADWLAGNPIKMRVGLDTNGYISIETLRDGSTWEVHSRTSYAVPEGAEFKLGIKFSNPYARLYSTPKAHLLEPEAPAMYFRYIESPDGNFEYPLFATEEEANYYDEQNGGSGTSHTHTYNDDPTNTTWHMPDTNGVMNGTSAPSFDLSLGQSATYTEISSLTNSDLAPPLFSQSDVTQEEGTNVNIQINPAGSNWSTSVSIYPSGSGLVWDGYSMVQGTLTDVGADTTYTITVTRGNSYGSRTGSMTVTATDVAPVQTNDTPWTKALDFSGGSEHLKQVTQSTGSNAIRMNGLSQLATANSDSSKTSSHTYSRPWATAIVFQTPNNNTNQHIWNSGEGAGSGDDNIYLRMSGANGELHFGWGREGVGYNEYHIGNFGGSYNQSTGQWWGIYISHDGTRLSAADATAANLVNAFDIRLMGTNDVSPVFSTLYNVGNDVNNWTSTGVRMDRAITGDFTIGGRGSNRSFHGKVASMIVTTLVKGATKPTDAEIKLMLTDPIKWEDDYKDGQIARYGYSGSNFTYGPSNSNSNYATQIWLMGDGTSDSYANGIRNHVEPTDQNYTKLQLNSMVSNDFETVSINGLT